MTTMIDAINAARAARGLPPLVHDAQLQEAAQWHVVDMSQHPGMLHIGSDGSDGGARILAKGYNWNTSGGRWAEIVGFGFNGDTAAMLRWWQNSPAHAAILYDSNVADIGVGYVVAPGSVWGHYWCVDFAAGDSEAARPFGVYVPGAWG